MRFSPTVLALLTLLPCAAAHTQGPVPAPGAKVRVTERRPSGRVHSGKLVSLDRDTLVIMETEYVKNLTTRSYVTVTTKVATAMIARLEVRNGRKPAALRGAAIGAGVGALTGVVAGLAMDRNDCFCEPGAGTAAGVGLVLGAAGAVVGALAGAVIGTDRWVLQPTWEPPAPSSPSGE